MNIIAYIIQKEFKQIFRNKAMLPIIFILPLLQLVILSNAATYEVKNIKFAYVDHDQTSTSRALIDKFNASTYFNVLTVFPSHEKASSAMLLGNVDVVLEIPNHFERNFIKEKTSDLGITINAIDGAAAGVESGYINQIIQSFNKNLKVTYRDASENVVKPVNITSIPSFWYNTTLDYKTFMVPGILVLLVSMITLFLSGMNIVREKEIGTLEQMNVTPIRKSQFIIGKLFPFWVIGMGLLTIGLILAKLIFDVPMLGSLLLLYGYTSIYILVILGMGLFISNFTDTQQQAMFIAWFFVVIFILMSGLFTPIESMPEWAQILTEFNPIKYYVEIIRMVMLKGSGFTDILPLALKTLAYAIVMNGLAVWSYKKTN
ncbi:ABC transporter permease [Gelidibacter japonicus]|uniref:ABC transporter permease n=1 Tax=Gelidibacter japonicus TaxID=1962232 RepID=UPI002021B3D2|nr:ABC transporter permease [Gelidibacter japonicus]MCL8007264.1 ABC transporter permease [Gelidibacter japonicus]